LTVTAAEAELGFFFRDQRKKRKAKRKETWWMARGGKPFIGVAAIITVLLLFQLTFTAHLRSPICKSTGATLPLFFIDSFFFYAASEAKTRSQEKKSKELSVA
jgi:hypothetical protein